MSKIQPKAFEANSSNIGRLKRKLQLLFRIFPTSSELPPNSNRFTLKLRNGVVFEASYSGSGKNSMVSSLGLWNVYKDNKSIILDMIRSTRMFRVVKHIEFWLHACSKYIHSHSLIYWLSCPFFPRKIVTKVIPASEMHREQYVYWFQKIFFQNFSTSNVGHLLSEYSR